MKNENTQLKNDFNQLTSDYFQLKNYIDQLEKNGTRIGSENEQLKKEVIELKDKLNVLWNEIENKMSFNLDSKIINENEKYNEKLKKWINPSRKIKAQLLYRKTENGYKISTFHELCDNKGPTLTLFRLDKGDIVGIYTPLSWDSTSGWKSDMDTFIFYLNKYKNIKN